MGYTERLSVPLWWWGLGAMLVVSLWLATIAALPAATAWGLTVAASVLMVGLLQWFGAARVEVGGGELRAGRARLPLELVGAVTPLDREATRRTVGTGADARAYLLLRSFVAGSVRVEVADPADPTPYWLLSTRHPSLLVEALTSGASPAAGSGP